MSDLERGARRAPYPNTLERLAKALRLDARGREHLRAAAREPAEQPAVRKRLPLVLTRFVGRARDQLEVKQLLAEARASA